MINLLPPELKKSYGYARKNVSLRRWVIAFVAAFVGLWVVATFGLLDLQQSTAHYNKTISSNEQSLKNNKYEFTQKQITDISGSFQLAVKVLGQEVLFSQLLKQIAETIPAKSNLVGLNISQTTGAIDIAAIATDYNTATQVQINLADPGNKIFNKADIISISCGKEAASDPAYPCSVNIRALFSANNPFLFINSKAVR